MMDRNNGVEFNVMTGPNSDWVFGYLILQMGNKNTSLGRHWEIIWKQKCNQKILKWKNKKVNNRPWIFTRCFYPKRLALRLLMCHSGADMQIRCLAHKSQQLGLWTLRFEVQNILGLGLKHPLNLLRSPPGWLRGSVRLSNHRGHQVHLGGPWDCELRGPGLHQGQEALCLHPGLGVQRLDRGQHQEVHVWASVTTVNAWTLCASSVNGWVIQSEWVFVSVCEIIYLNVGSSTGWRYCLSD